MYCRFPKEYFFEIEKIENLLEFEEIEDVEDMRGIEEDNLNVSDIFEFDSNDDDDDDERNKCKCNKKKEEHVEHKCEKPIDKKNNECGCKKEKSKNKCKEEGKFFTIADDEYVEEIKVEIHDCKCNCKK